MLGHVRKEPGLLSRWPLLLWSLEEIGRPAGKAGRGPLALPGPHFPRLSGGAVSPVTDDESWQGADLEETRPEDPSAPAPETPH